MANSNFNLQVAADNLVAALGKNRDREVLARRYGLGLPKRETLDKIGQSFGITRERVRQVERSAIKRLQQSGGAQLKAVNQKLTTIVQREGGVATLERLADQLGAKADQLAYVYFFSPRFAGP